MRHKISTAFTLNLALILSGFLNQTALAEETAHCKYPELAIEMPGTPPLKKIALTFDDGPSRETTPQILAILKKYNIKATFFIEGQNAVGNEDLLQQEIAAGHVLGNHTFTHPHLNQTPHNEIVSEFTKTQTLLSPYTKSSLRLARFPFGDSSCDAESVAESMHYNIIGWHVDSCDWSYAEGLPDGSCIDEASLRERFKNDYTGWLQYQLASSHGGITLMHDTEQFTVDHLEGLIKLWLSEGYTFIQIDHANFPQIIPAPKP